MNGVQSYIVTILSLLGLQVSGDVAGLTIYTNRRGKVVYYPQSPAEKPPSALQRQQRQRFRLAQQTWQLLNPETKMQWELAAKRASLTATGQNLFISASLTPNPHALTAIATRTSTTITQPDYIPW